MGDVSNYTAVVNGSASSPGPTAEEINKVLFGAHGVFIMTVCLVGVFANILNIIILSKSIGVTTHKIFLGMACADLIVNAIFISHSSAYMLRTQPLYGLEGPPNLMEGITYSLYYWYEMWFLAANIFMCISNWCAVLLVAVRLLVVTFPLKEPTYISNTKINLAICLVYVFGFVLQIPDWITLYVNENKAITTYPNLIKYRDISAVGSGLVPMCLCAIFTALLIVQLKRSSNDIKGTLGNAQLATRLKDERHLTVTLISVVVFFVVTSLPTVIYWVLTRRGYFKTHQFAAYNQHIIYSVMFALVAVNYTGNFFIYIFAHKAFRKSFVKLFANISATVSFSYYD